MSSKVEVEVATEEAAAVGPEVVVATAQVAATMEVVMVTTSSQRAMAARKGGRNLGTWRCR